MSRANPHADRNLLFGLLAVQLDFLRPDQLVEGMKAWALDKSTPLGRILLDQGTLSPEHHALLEPLLEAHVARHGGDPARSLHALGALTTVRDAVAPVDDPDVQASLARLHISSVSRTDRAAPDTPPPPPVGEHATRRSSNSDRYRVLRPHARGGLGQVFVARDEELGRIVALKEIQDEHVADAALRRRFVLEAEINGNLEHPGIVPVYGLGAHTDGRPYYAMRFVQGESLKQAVAAFHRDLPALDDSACRLRFHQLLRRFVDICKAIAYAHSRGVLHRDLKPANVMLGTYGETLIIDWGLAKALGKSDPDEVRTVQLSADDEPLVPPSGSEGDPTRAGHALGTPQYMSPEQANGRLDALGPATDVYALGGILYNLLTGHPPAVGGSRDEVLDHVRKGGITPPRSIAPRAPKALEAVCLKALAHAPGDRYESARSLADEVERWLAGEPVAAYREPLGVRLGRWARRHRTAVTAAAVAVLVATAALALANRRLSRVNEALRRAEVAADGRLDLALRAIGDFHTGVGQDVLLTVADLRPLRERLLAQPRRYYEDLARELEAAPERDARAAFLLAEARLGLGQVDFQLGKLDDAIAQYEAAEAQFRALVADQPDDPAHRNGLAHALANRGFAVAAQEKAEEAIALDREAIELWSVLAAQHPDEPEYRDRLANARNNLGMIQKKLNQLDEAAAAHQAAIDLWAALAARHPDEPKYRDGQAKALANLGIVRFAEADLDGDIAATGEALAIWEDLAATYPEEPSHLRYLATAASNLGRAHATRGDFDAADGVYRKGIPIAERLVADQPNVPDSHNTLARLHTNHGVLKFQRGDPAGAGESMTRAADAYEALAARFPDRPEYLSNFAAALGNLGVLRRETGDLPGAAEAFRRVLPVEARLAESFPEQPNYRSSLAGTRINLGQLLTRTGALEDAERSLRDAIADLDRLVAAYPERRDYRSVRARALESLGTVLARSDRPDEAESTFREAIAEQRAVLESAADVVQARVFLGDHLGRLAALLRERGRFDEAVATVRERRDATDANSKEGHYAVAAELARCSAAAEGETGEALAVEAVEALGRAVAAGWTDAEHLAGDPAFEPLRDRDDYREVVAVLDGPTLREAEPPAR